MTFPATDFLSRQTTQAESSAYSKYCPHEPTEPQLRAINSTARLWLYGGAAGGGKSDALLMRAIKHVDTPGYSALLLRRTYPQLTNSQEGLLPRAAEWFGGTGARWAASTNTWHFPCPGGGESQIKLGYMQHEADKLNYQGGAYQFVGFDELTQFTKTQFLYLASRLRRLEGSEVPSQLAGGTNPGGPGHEWVKAMFVGDESTGLVPDPETAFYPALLSDNPYLDQEDYRKNLALLDETTRLQLEDGLWIRDTAGLVYKYTRDLNWCAELPDGHDWRYCLGADYGWNGVAFVEWAYAATTPIAYATWEFKQPGLDVEDASRVMSERIEYRRRTTGRGYDRILGDPGGGGKQYIEYGKRRWHLPIEVADKVDKVAFQKLLNGDFSRGRAMVVDASESGETGCSAYPEEMAKVRKKEGEECEADNQENHLCDAGLYGWRWLCHHRGQTPQDAPAPGSRAAVDAEAKATRDAAVTASLKRAKAQNREQRRELARRMRRR